MWLTWFFLKPCAEATPKTSRIYFMIAHFDIAKSFITDEKRPQILLLHFLLL